MADNEEAEIGVFEGWKLATARLVESGLNSLPTDTKLYIDQKLGEGAQVGLMATIDPVFVIRLALIDANGKLIKELCQIEDMGSDTVN